MEQKIVTFNVAKAIKDAGYPQEEKYPIGQPFYTVPGSKMYGIDEHYRPFPMKNTAKRLYHIGNECVKYEKNFILAPTYLDVWLWLWKEKDIRLVPVDTTVSGKYIGIVAVRIGLHIFKGETPEEAIASAIDYLVDNDLIK